MTGEAAMDFQRGVKNVVHELGHAYNDSFGSSAPTGGAANSMTDDMAGRRNQMLRPNDPAGRYDWQQHPDSNTQSEVFADMFIANTYNAWNIDPANSQWVNEAKMWMNQWIP